MAATATMAAADWSSLPDDLIRRLAHRFLAADDLDYYMDFRAVCRSWRSVTTDPRADGTDPRFHPRNWAMLSKRDEPNGDVLVSFVNLGTGRFLCKNLPELLRYFLFAATDGGLLVLWEVEPPHGVRVLNPFTCYFVARFSVPVLGYDVRKMAVTTSPTMTLFISGVRNNLVGWADLNSTRFNEFWVLYPDELLSMTSFAGDVYVTNRHGSIVVSSSSATADDIAGEKRRSAGTITMTTAIPAVEGGGASSYYLVESAGELLLVSFRCTAAGGVDVAVHKVDTVRKLLQPVESIGNRAIFVSQIRCISVEANMFPTVEAGCIYFVEPTLTSNNEHATAIFYHRLGYQRHETVVECGERTRRQVGPSTLVQVLGDYCMLMPIFEPYMMLHGGDDDSEA